jgi:hypothetical protein
MTTRSGLILLVLCCIALLGMARQNFVAQAEARHPERIFQEAPEMSATQVQSLRDEVNKMHVLVEQMETNLSLVDTTQSPLKHQFQLEIDMWKLTIQRMDRQLQGPK